MSISVNAIVGKSSMIFAIIPPMISPQVATLGLLMARTASVVAYCAPDAEVADEATVVAAIAAAATLGGMWTMLGPANAENAFGFDGGGGGGVPTLHSRVGKFGSSICRVPPSLAH